MMFLNVLRGIGRRRLRHSGEAPVVADWLVRGLEMQAAGNHPAAEDALRRAIAQHPSRGEAHHALGALLLRCNRAQEAIAPLETAAGLLSRESAVQLHLGVAYWTLRMTVKALAALAAALRLDPNLAAAHNNLGAIYQSLCHLSDAESAFLRALAIDPSPVDVWRNLARVQIDLGKPQAAIAAYRKCLTPEAFAGDPPAPGAPRPLLEAQWNLGLAQLACGDLAPGWRNYELRLDARLGLVSACDLPHTSWEGESLRGRRLVVWGEQGIGDEILFASMYPDVLRQDGECVLECKAKLVKLFERSFPQARVVARTQPPHPEALAAHCQIAAGSLGRLLRPELSSFPKRRGYLVADPQRVDYWRGRVAELGPGLKVGFSWRSNNTKAERALACTRLEQWGPLFAVEGVQWVSLQYDECADELRDAQERFGVRLHRFAEVDYFDDLDEVAALMAALDLVISAPTTVSIQAAALGVRTWQMTYGTDWQTLGTQTNPWLPALERFERRADASWEEVIAQVAQALQLLNAAGGTGPADRSAPQDASQSPAMRGR